MRHKHRSAVFLLLAASLTACVPAVRQPIPGSPSDMATPAPSAPSEPPPPLEPDEPETAREAGVRTASFSAMPGWREINVADAFAAFQKSCYAVTRRSDPSRLAISDDWLVPCEAAKQAGAAADPRRFFETNFTPVIVSGGNAFVTGYYEPEIAGCRVKSPDCAVPIYGRPDDLVKAEQPDPENPGATKPMTGRLDENGNFTLYHDRAAIDAGALAGRGLEIAYAKDYIELFFLQIQGSGRLRLPDGGVMRIGYDGQNAREYVGIGRRLRDMNALAPGEASMQGIMRWLRANPDRGRALMLENKSYIFFKELTGEGPIGAMGAPVTPEVSLAADPRFVTLGAPVFLTTRYMDESGRFQPFSKLMVAQDTGGAIKGANRFDLFWGAGERARTIAGGLSSEGTAYILLPNAAAAKLMRDMPLAALDRQGKAAL
ncbi:Membrane-bound lytic murein transglycosylase A precursor [Pacificimonas flava]|uniref:peptidoglycan lytic exotransglycosylase n=2 Tax=Pacificimonas flava TaxID=1234595 RepID=M2TAF1_9SPHN|nr:Membrane-bound lytic murein transglycosylase A precursor [Pacificimonas flava]